MPPERLEIFVINKENSIFTPPAREESEKLKSALGQGMSALDLWRSLLQPVEHRILNQDLPIYQFP